MFAEFDWAEATRSSPILMVLLVCSLVTMAVAIERLLYYRRRSGDPEQTLHRTLHPALILKPGHSRIRFGVLAVSPSTGAGSLVYLAPF